VAVALALIAASGVRVARAAWWGPSKAKLAQDDAFHKLVARGDAYLLEARNTAVQKEPTLRAASERSARAAIEAYDRALAVREDPDVLYRVLRALSYLGDTPERWHGTIATFDRFRAAAPRDPRETMLIPELCSALSKVGDLAAFARAYEEYQTFRQRFDEAHPPSNLSTFSTNTAELTMALGPERLADAIELYEIGIKYAQDRQEGFLARFGAAVAYDRAGQYGTAMEHVMVAFEIEAGPKWPSRPGPPVMTLLGDSVYFVPDGDVEFYFGLAYQVFGDAPSAAAHYREFLRRLPNSPYAARAREHLAEVGGGAP
jgi:tetratricopeptide (TPR) repeat protein